MASGEVDNGPGTGTGDQGYVPDVPGENAVVPPELAVQNADDIRRGYPPPATPSAAEV